jgi:hypothetical protein
MALAGMLRDPVDKSDFHECHARARAEVLGVIGIGDQFARSRRTARAYISKPDPRAYEIR